MIYVFLSYPYALEQVDRIVAGLVEQIQRVIEIRGEGCVYSYRIGAHLRNVLEPSQVFAFGDGKLSRECSGLSGSEVHAFYEFLLPAAVYIDKEVAALHF